MDEPKKMIGPMLTTYGGFYLPGPDDSSEPGTVLTEASQQYLKHPADLYAPGPGVWEYLGPAAPAITSESTNPPPAAVSQTKKESEKAADKTKEKQ